MHQDTRLNLGVPVSDSLKGALFSKPKNIFDGIETAYPLYEHQKRAIQKCLKTFDSCFNGFGFLMDMGTGKSFTTLTMARMLRKQDKIKALIVICPKSLIDGDTWHKEIAKHVIESTKIVTWNATKAKSDKWQKEFDGLFNTTCFPVFIVNVEAFQVKNEVLAKCFKKLEKLPVLLALDESSKIASPTASRSKAVVKIADKALYKVILTGTEIRNSPLDVYMQAEFLQKGFWGKNFYQFKQRYARLVTKYLSGGRQFLAIEGYQNLDELQEKIDKVVYRAHKEDCLDLPEKIYVDLCVDLSSEQKKIYSDFRDKLLAMVADELVTLPNKISAFQKLRQITGGTVCVEGIGQRLKSNPKLDILLDDLEDTSEQAIIFCAFSEEIQLVHEALVKAGYTSAIFDGTTDSKARQKAIVDHTSGDVRFLVTNPACASMGLNLQHCHLIYWYSLPLSMVDSEQAEARIHRTGQTVACVYKRIIARDTVDERVLSLLEQKKNFLDGFRHGTLADILKLV